MKTKKLGRKLDFKKNTVASLGNTGMKNIQGGIYSVPYLGCGVPLTDDCQTNGRFTCLAKDCAGNS